MRVIKVYKSREFDVVIVNDVRGIHCFKCNMISFNMNDIARKYCVICKIFHNEYPDDVSIIGM